MTTTNQSHEPERMAESDELAGCPFCPRPTEVFLNSRLGNIHVEHGEIRQYWVECDECFAHGPSELNRALAISGWNKRTHPEIKATNFATLWSTAPRSRTARIEREDAEWWFNQNREGTTTAVKAAVLGEQP